MARCDEGYRCRVCGLDVDPITESGLYLSFVLGETPLEAIHTEREWHIRCQPERAQFIADAAFEPAECAGPFAKSGLDAAFVAEETARVTRGWRHLQAIPTLGLALPEYPLAEEETSPPVPLSFWERGTGGEVSLLPHAE